MFGKGQVHEELTVIKFQRQTNDLRSSLASCHASNLHFQILPLSLGSGVRGLGTSYVCAQHHQIQPSAGTHLSPSREKVNHFKIRFIYEII